MKKKIITIGFVFFLIVISLACFVKAEDYDVGGGFGISVVAGNASINNTNNTPTTNNSVVYSDNNYNDEENEVADTFSSAYDKNNEETEAVNTMTNTEITEKIMLNQKVQKNKNAAVIFIYWIISNVALLAILMALIVKYPKIIIKK